MCGYLLVCTMVRVPMGMTALMILGKTIKICVCVLMMSALGCASNARWQPIASGTQINITASKSEVDAPGTMTSGEAIGGGAVKGMGAGAYAGGYMSFLCGPFAFFCILPFAGVGATIGGIGGVAAGAMQGLPGEKADALDKIIADSLANAGDLADRLRESLIEKSEGEWQVGNEVLYPEILVKVESLSLMHIKDDRLALSVTSSMIVRYGDRKKRDVTLPRLFKSRSATHDIDDWIVDDGELFRSEIEAGLQKSAAQLFNALSG